MSKINEERLKRASYAIERGLLEDIKLDGDEYVVHHARDVNGTTIREHIGDFATLEEALQAWDDAEDGLFPSAFNDEYPVPDGEPSQRWDDYEFDEDGYKIYRHR